MCKKLTYLVSFVLVLSMAGTASAELILHWRFDEGSGNIAHDSSGNGHDGIIEGATWTVGKIDSCLEFGGDGDRVVDENAPNYLNGLDALSIAIWIKSDVAPTDKGFIICEQPDGGDNIITMRYDSAGANGGGTSLLKMAVVAPNDEQQLESSSNLQVTEWQHVALTWSRGEQLKFYVNAVLDTPQANGAPRDVSTGDVTTLIVGWGGKFSDAGVGGWDGLIDDVRIYDHVLSEVQILGAMEGEVWPYAWGPEPADGAKYVNPNVELSWSPGDGAQLHIVYFGDNFDDVNHDAGGFLLETTTYTPGPLELDKVYYWRVNEFDGVVIHKGEVWSFRTIPEIDPNLIGGWKFDEGSGTIAYDSSGNGNDGTLEDGPTVVDGQFGQALAFEDNRVAIPASDSLTADLFQGSFTFSAWINPKRVGDTWQQIFRSMKEDDTSNDTLFINNDGRLSWRGRIGGGWAGGMCETASGVVPADQWTHVAVTGDGTNFRIYVNGTLSQESAFQTTDGSNATYYLGGDPTWIGESYSGMIDDVLIYNVALSAEEIEALAQ